MRYSSSQMSVETPLMSADDPRGRVHFSHFMYLLPTIGSCPEISHLVPQCITWTTEQAGVVGVGRAAVRGRGWQLLLCLLLLLLLLRQLLLLRLLLLLLLRLLLLRRTAARRCG